jgi:Flp pilus assembly protein TadG
MGGQAGMVTAETAVVLPVLLLVLAATVGALVIVGSQLRCVDAAREAVRAAARGESAPVVRSLAARAAPSGASTSLVTGDGSVTVTVTAPVRPLGPLPLVVRVTAAATGELEPGATGAPP